MASLLIIILIRNSTVIRLPNKNPKRINHFLYDKFSNKTQITMNLSFVFFKINKTYPFPHYYNRE